MTAPRSVPVHETCELTKGQVFGETGFIQIGIAIGIGIDWNAERRTSNAERRSEKTPNSEHRATALRNHAKKLMPLIN